MVDSSGVGVLGVVDDLGFPVVSIPSGVYVEPRVVDSSGVDVVDVIDIEAELVSS